MSTPSQEGFKQRHILSPHQCIPTAEELEEGLRGICRHGSQWPPN